MTAIHIPNTQGRTFWILGWGKSGRAAAQVLSHSGAVFSVWDDQESARQEASECGYPIANPALASLSPADSLIVAPGIPLTHPTPNPAILQARKAGAEIIGDIELLFRACPQASYIGITGTNGKSTTTALIGHILQSSGLKVQIGGNLGTAALSLDALDATGIYVLELSSFQLDLIQSNALSIAILLNITPDHFDRHGDMDGYCKAKERIIRHAHQGKQTLIIGVDDPETTAIANRAGQMDHIDLWPLSVCHSLDKGYEAATDTLVLNINGHKEKLLAFADLPRLLGKHNAQNVAAAYAACRALNLDAVSIVKGIQSFPGLAHRQEWVATLDGVTFINDSKATNADAAAKALVCYPSIHWIIGGKPKSGGLNGLEAFIGSVRHAYLIGKAMDEFEAWCDGKIPTTRCETLDKAVQESFVNARKEKGFSTQPPVVLLSPACASFDQFSSFEHRGNVFKKLVVDLQIQLQKAEG